MIKNSRIVEAFGSFSNISKIKQREIYCPIANLRAITTPLLASDDLSLKTIISSVATYDYELVKILYDHVKFTDIGDDKDFNYFISNISEIDRLIILWGIFASTYSTLGSQDIKCDNCEAEYKLDIDLEQIIHNDSITIWQEDAPFTEYIFPIKKDINVENIYSLTFNTCLPTIKKHLDVLSLIPTSKIKTNFNKSGVIFSRSEELTFITKNISVSKTENDENPIIFSQTKDIHSIISNFIPLDIIDYVLDIYSNKFNKYVPFFRKEFICDNCQNQIIYPVDIEFSLFRRFLRR